MLTGPMIGPVHQGDQAPHLVVDVAEAARLAAVAEHRERVAAERLVHEVRDHATVVGLHPRPVRVEDAHDPDVDAVLAVGRPS
jgi:hypothetical protein